MKTTLKISVFLVALFLLSGFSAQKRAERHIRKAVALCPELVQTTAHPIDTVLTVQGFADATYIPLHDVMSGDTLYKATEHGTFIVNMDKHTNEIRVGFIAAPRSVRLTDTVHYAKLSYTKETPGPSSDGSGEFFSGFLACFAGIIIAAYLLFRRKH